jgi:hypothetical protein
MSNDATGPPRLYSVDPATKAALARITRRAHCACLAVRTKKGTPLVPNMHIEAQDQSMAGWRQVTNLIERLARTSVAILEPSAQIAWEEWMRVITLPPEVAYLSQVKEVRLYGSHLRRLPTEIGRMSSLRELDIYTSYSLHWLPYEVTRCANLSASRMSTRALYGNRNTRLPFPRLSAPIDVLLLATCSVCDQPFDARTPQPFWTTQRVGTDYVPLLIHSCSNACIDPVPSAPSGFFERPHKGSGGVGKQSPSSGCGLQPKISSVLYSLRAPRRAPPKSAMPDLARSDNCRGSTTLARLLG